MLFMAVAAMGVDEGTGQDDATWAADEGDGLGSRVSGSGRVSASKFGIGIA